MFAVIDCKAAQFGQNMIIYHIIYYNNNNNSKMYACIF